MKYIIRSALLSAFISSAGQAAGVIVIPPSALPESARQNAEAMLLHESAGGRTYLYLEQLDGAKLTVLDVTDPARIKAEKIVPLTAPGAFDFVTPLGDRAELIRFRDSGEQALLDLRKPKVPAYETMPGLTVTGQAKSLGDGAILLTDQRGEMPPVTHYQIVDTAAGVMDVAGVRQEITNTDTGTTFLLAEQGLFVIRRPALETVFESVPMNSGN